MYESLATSEASNDDMLKCIICNRDAVDAVLLSCLHSSCRQCAAAKVGAIVTCPTCQVTTDTSTAIHNLFVSSHTHRSQVLKDVFACTRCNSEDIEPALAVTWCYTCQYSLCLDCQNSENGLHATHRVMCLNENTNLSELYCPPSRSCKKHGEDLKLICCSCNCECCYTCAHDCRSLSHDVYPIDGPEALNRTNACVTQANCILTDLHLAISELHTHLGYYEIVSSTREKSLEKLKNAKQMAIDSISKAYENAADSLLECWDTLAVKSLDRQEMIERLTKRVEWTNKYCQKLLNYNEKAGLLPQIDAVIHCLRNLVEEARQIRKPVDPLKLISFSLCLPSDMDSIASGWFGLAQLVSDDLNDSFDDFPSEKSDDYYTRKVATLKELEQLLQDEKEQQQSLQLERQAMWKLQSDLAAKDRLLDAAKNEVKRLQYQRVEQEEELQRERRKNEQLQIEVDSLTEQLEEECSSSEASSTNPEGNDGGIGVMRVAGSFRSIKETDRCYDLAVSYCNTVLVAQGDEGLFEYDFVNDSTISNWSPSSPDSVTAVEAVSGYRVVIALRKAKAVVVLQSDEDSKTWSENLTFSLGVTPFTLSVYGDVVAVSEWTQRERGARSSNPGPTLNLLSLATSSVLLRKNLHFGIFSVAAMECTVAVASWTRGGIDHDRSNKPFFVASYGHDGRRRWQRQFADRVYGICGSPSTPVLYLAFRNTNSVIAIGEMSGRNLTNICLDNNSITNPWRLSVSRGKGPAVLTVLESDFMSITIYPIVALTIL